MTQDRIARLLAVQEIDMEILELEERREEVPRRRAEVASEIIALEEEQAEREDRLEKTRLDRRQRESELESREEQLKRYEQQLNEVKTNVAYSALLTEIQGTRREIGELEEEILELMSGREEHEARLGEIAEALEEKRAAASDELEALDAEAKELDRRLAEKRERRSGMTDAIDPNLYRTYDRMRRRRRFPALVALRGHACGACYARMPPQVVQEIQHDGALHACESCGVLVYATPSPAESASEPADAR